MSHKVKPPLPGDITTDPEDLDIFIQQNDIPWNDVLNAADAALEDNGGFIQLEALLRAARSTGPREILIKLAVNRHLLQLQLAAVRIQSRIRQYQSRNRVDRIRRRFHLFQGITAQLCEVVVEEAVLGGCLEISMHAILTHERYQQHKQLVHETLMEEVEDIAREVVQSLASEVVVEIVEQAAEAVLQHRPKVEVDELRVSRNPLIRVMVGLSDEEVDRMIRPVVVEVSESIFFALFKTWTDDDVMAVLADDRRSWRRWTSTCCEHTVPSFSITLCHKSWNPSLWTHCLTCS